MADLLGTGEAARDGPLVAKATVQFVILGRPIAGLGVATVIDAALPHRANAIP
jgi:hypothetical protein